VYLVVSGKMNNVPKQHAAGPPEARDPMQLHRLHRLEAGPVAALKQISKLLKLNYEPL